MGGGTDTPRRLRRRGLVTMDPSDLNLVLLVATALSRAADAIRDKLAQFDAAGVRRSDQPACRPVHEAHPAALVDRTELGAAVDFFEENRALTPISGNAPPGAPVCPARRQD